MSRRSSAVSRFESSSRRATRATAWSSVVAPSSATQHLRFVELSSKSGHVPSSRTSTVEVTAPVRSSSWSNRVSSTSRSSAVEHRLAVARKHVERGEDALDLIARELELVLVDAVGAHDVMIARALVHDDAALGDPPCAEPGEIGRPLVDRRCVRGGVGARWSFQPAAWSTGRSRRARGSMRRTRCPRATRARARRARLPMPRAS